MATIHPNAVEVDGHEDLFSGVCVEGIDPDLIVGGIELFGPELVDDGIGWDLVGIAAVDHHLVLLVEHGDCTLNLGQVEIPDLVGCGHHGGKQHC